MLTAVTTALVLLAAGARSVGSAEDGSTALMAGTENFWYGNMEDRLLQQIEAVETVATANEVLERSLRKLAQEKKRRQGVA